MSLVGSKEVQLSDLRSRGAARWIFGVAIALGLAFAVPRGACAGPTAPSTYFSSHGQVHVEILLDHIAIVARGGGKVDSAVIYVQGRMAGGGTAQRLNPRIVSFGLPPSMSSLERRDSLVAFARRVKQGAPQYIADAGLAVRIEGQGLPVVVTDKFVVRFRDKVTRQQIDALNAANGVVVLDESKYWPNQFLLSVTDRSRFDALGMANQYHGSRLVEWAHPDFFHPFQARQAPNDPDYGKQWHLNNSGQSTGSWNTRGTVDADIDWPEAWELAKTAGAKAITIAVIDGGVDLDHEDLKNRLWSASDGSHGYDYVDCEGVSPPTPCGDTDPRPNPADVYGSAEYFDDHHGTQVAGIICAETDNDLGVAGVCPFATLMVVRKAYDEFYVAEGFGYVKDHGASVVNCSWGNASIGSDTPTLNSAIDDVVAAGIPVVFAGGYASAWNDCSPEADWELAEHSTVIAVGGSTNWDRVATKSPCGKHIGLLAPWGLGAGDRGFGYKGTLDIWTTAWDVSKPNTYAYFEGSSAAAPVVSGVAGLIVSAQDPSHTALTAEQIRDVMQDTADKIEPSDAGYGSESGFSAPSTTAGPTHGFGRVNALEAVRLVAATTARGKGGVDVFLRDNTLDWGNTEQPSNVRFEPVRGYEPHWQSMDVKVDAGPDYQTAPTTSTEFDDLVDEGPAGGADNKIYVRVRNRGPIAAADVTVKVFWTFASATEPRLPENFWSTFSSISATSPLNGEWRVAGVAGPREIAYSGCSAAWKARGGGGASSDDAAAIYEVDWKPAVAESYDSFRVLRHFSILAIVDSPSDHPGPLAKDPADRIAADFDADALAAADNNVTLRNVLSLTADEAKSLTFEFYLRNPTTSVIAASYKIEAPDGWVTTQGDILEGWPIEMQPTENRKLPVVMSLGVPDGSSGDIDIFQYVASASSVVPPSRPTGGFTIRVAGAATSATSGGIAPCNIWLVIIIIVLLIFLFFLLVRRMVLNKP